MAKNKKKSNSHALARSGHGKPHKYNPQVKGRYHRKRHGKNPWLGYTWKDLAALTGGAIGGTVVPARIVGFLMPTDSAQPGGTSWKGIGAELFVGQGIAWGANKIGWKNVSLGAMIANAGLIALRVVDKLFNSNMFTVATAQTPQGTSFYTADGMVLLPTNPLQTGKVALPAASPALSGGVAPKLSQSGTSSFDIVGA